MWTIFVPVGTGCQYEKNSSPSFVFFCTRAACQLRPSSKLTSTLLPTAVKRRNEPAGAAVGNATRVDVPPRTKRVSGLSIVNGMAGLMLTLSQCQVFGPSTHGEAHAPLSGLYEWWPSCNTPWLQ